MIQDRKSKKGAAAGLIFAAVVLVLVVLLENLSSLLPSVPAVLQPTSQLFTVLKKGAVYSLVAVSMNLLNGFTGLFSLGQAGFMLLGAYTYAILTVPVSAKDSVYYLYGGSAVPFSLPDLFGGVDTPAGLILGVLCEASTILNPTVIIILVIGILALAISAVGGLLGGWLMYLVHKAKREDFNPTIGIAGVSCVPTTAKLAQHAAQDENPFAVILPVAMGANISGVITSAIAAGIFVTTIGMV